MIYSVSEMSRNIYTAAQLALKSRSSAGTWQTAPGHWDKSKTSGKGWLGIASIQQLQRERQPSSSGADDPTARRQCHAATAEEPRLETSFPTQCQGLLPEIPCPAQLVLKRMEKRNKRRGRCQYGQRYALVPWL